MCCAKCNAKCSERRRKMNNLKRHLLFQSGADYQVYVGKNYNGAVKPHSHSFYQCLFVTEGHVLQRQNKFEYNQYVNDFFFTPQGMEHSLYVFGTNTKYYCLSFSRELAMEVFTMFHGLQESTLTAQPVIHVSEDAARQFCILCELLMEEQACTFSKNMHIGFYLTVSALILVLRTAYTDSEEEKCAIGKTAEESIRACMDYIDEHYKKDLTINDLARISTLSKTSLCNLFPKISGMTIKHYITEKRIHEAVQLTYRSNLTFTEIAEAVGYHDFSTFYRNFIKIAGVTPSEYRNQAIAILTPPKA